MISEEQTQVNGIKLIQYIDPEIEYWAELYLKLKQFGLTGVATFNEFFEKNRHKQPESKPEGNGRYVGLQRAAKVIQAAFRGKTI